MKEDGCCLWILPTAAITVDDFIKDFGANAVVEFPFCGITATC
jgi:hypothetical protein